MNDAAKNDEKPTVANDDNETQGTGGEDSGLADIRRVAAAMPAPLEDSHEIVLPPEPKSDDDEPIVDGGFGASAGASLVESPKPVAQGTSSAGSNTLPLLGIAIGVLAIVGVGLAIVAGGDEPKEPTQAAVAVDAPKPPKEKRAKPASELAAEPSRPEPNEDEGEEAAASDGENRDADKTPTEKAGTSSAKAKKSRDPGKQEKQPGSSSEEPPTTKAETPAPVPEPEPAKPITADCVLNPDAPGCDRGGSKKKADDSATADDSDLPDKLTNAQIRVTLRSFKAAAKACGPKHGVAAGTKVRIKISISGKTGEVVSATPLADHADSPLGKCVADAIRRAKFARFKKTVMGVTYPVTL